jgi:hypothetical protein
LVGVAHLDVFEGNGRLGGDSPRDNRGKFGRTPLTRACSIGGGAERAGQNQGRAPVVGGEICVAAAHRETVGLADQRAADDLDRQIQIGRHTRDDRTS